MKTPNIIREAANRLRNNMTKSEVILWNYIKSSKMGVQFLRQKPICVSIEDNGFNRFIIPDFYCFEKRLIIEVDGKIHNLKDVYNLDQVKEKLLINIGFNIIRIKNDDILNNINLVIKDIKKYII